jgi:hypothetical protein
MADGTDTHTPTNNRQASDTYRSWRIKNPF